MRCWSKLDRFRDIRHTRLPFFQYPKTTNLPSLSIISIMSPSVSNCASLRHSSNSSSTRRASTGPRPVSVSSTSLHVQAEHPFVSAAAIQINRTVSVTVEVLSGSALASHMDASQYHTPVTTSCYSPTTHEYQMHGTSTSYSSQEVYPFIPPTTGGSSSSYYDQSSTSGTQGSLGFPYGSSEHPLLLKSLCQQQKGRYSL